MTREIPFVAKRPAGNAPWTMFGGTRELYDRWSPHICGIACCRSLILAKHRSAPSLWDLTELGIRLGVFVEDGPSIRGAFHAPLAQLLGQFNIRAKPFRSLRGRALEAAVSDGPVLLSIDLARLESGHVGSHLVLVFDLEPEGYVVHDNAGLMGNPGSNCRVSVNRIEEISNGKGIAVGAWDSQAVPTDRIGPRLGLFDINNEV